MQSLIVAAGIQALVELDSRMSVVLEGHRIAEVRLGLRPPAIDKQDTARRSCWIQGRGG